MDGTDATTMPSPRILGAGSQKRSRFTEIVASRRVPATGSVTGGGLCERRRRGDLTATGEPARSPEPSRSRRTVAPGRAVLDQRPDCVRPRSGSPGGIGERTTVGGRPPTRADVPGRSWQRGYFAKIIVGPPPLRPTQKEITVIWNAAALTTAAEARDRVEPDELDEIGGQITFSAAGRRGGVRGPGRRPGARPGQRTAQPRRR
jgi:hypothetical protein